MTYSRWEHWLFRYARLPECCAIGLFILSTGIFSDAFAPLKAAEQAGIALELSLGIGLLVFMKITRPVFYSLGKGVVSMRRIPSAAYLGIAMSLFFAMAAYLSGALFDHIPHIADSESQYIGAKIFSTGHWFASSPPLREFFNVQFMVNDGKFYSNYPPGHMLIQSLGHVLELPWLVNPLLGVSALAAIYALAREVADEPTARIAVALALFSPLLVFMSSEYMNHATTLVCATLFLLFYIRSLRTRNARDALLCGLAIGYLFITRPQTALPFALPVALHCLYLLLRGRHVWRTALISLAGFSGMLAFLFYYNLQTTGHPLLMGYMLDTRPDFAQQAFAWPLASARDWRLGITNMAFRLIDLQSGLFGWPSFSLLFVFILFLFRAQKPYCGVMLASCIALALGLMFTHFGDNIFDARYLYETSGALTVLTALALKRLPAILRGKLRIRLRHAALSGGIAAFVTILFIFALLQKDRELYDRYADNYWEGNVGFYHNVVSHVQTPALVFVRNPDQLYRFVSFTLPLDEHAPVIFARDRQALNPLLAARFPERHIYIADLQWIAPWTQGMLK